MPKEKKTKNLPKKVKEGGLFSNKDYGSTLTELKRQIKESQVRAITAANKELIHLYWKIGKTIVEKQEKSGWGTKIIEKLAKDIQNSFPGIEGFSRTNIFRMRAFYIAYQTNPPAGGQFQNDPLEILASIPWRHNSVLVEKLKKHEERMWYAQKTIEHGWSRSVLEIMIGNSLHSRQGKAITNFKAVMPSPQSDLAQQATKDPYLFDFIALSDDVMEKDIENQLTEHIQKFLMELGQGFAFVGRQYPIKAGKKDLYIDLLFYHLTLRCYIIVELKAKEFDSRDAGQMSVYLSAVDDLLRHEGDNPSIGIILCRTKDNVFVEYALRNFNRPIGVAEYETKLVETLPKELKSSLPTVKEIEAELEQDIPNNESPDKKKKGRKKSKEK
ncbi:MAG: PDDEXK nuclease domain-containing protein [Simkaniaceae bacterium]|nr:PDDEXK nuclease domain-containing protein [Simkaniaceae bacterium]MCF7852220.1 PDDEXK nuclease domain-containing protein [Simkaniaceae bacterium]